MVLEGVDFQAATLTEDDGPALQRVLESCADYYDLVMGHAPGPSEALAVFLAGPEEGADPAGKQLLGIWSRASRELIGVLDVFRDYPKPGAWYIGLLLLAPARRSGGMGRRIMERFMNEAQRRGATELQLNVGDQNAAGHRFWSSLGFSEMRRWRQRYGNKESSFIRMRHQLGTIARETSTQL